MVIPEPTTYARIARRIRVPLTFLFTVVCLWLAQPSWMSMAIGAAIMLFGLFLRARAAGHVQKDRVLTVTGPYAYTRNPLYLGSILLALGFAVAAQNLWIGLVLVLLFLAIYLPLIYAEEAYLGATFPGFAEYKSAVPRLIPRLTAVRFKTHDAAAEEAARRSGGFLRERYMKVREYNSIIGAVVLLAALAAKILWHARNAH